MKSMHFIIAFCGLFLPLVSANLRLNPTFPRSSGGGDQDPERCGVARDEEECLAIDENCQWDDPRCYYKEPTKPCDSLDQTGCQRRGDCVWMSDNRICTEKEETSCASLDQPDCGTSSECVWMTAVNDDTGDACMEKKEIEQKCIAEGYEISSKDSCNSVKGCSWAGSGDEQFCTVAPTQPDCDGLRRAKCKQKGCVFKKKKCSGRWWDPKFLSSLIGMTGDEAKQAIKDKYGEKTYKVALIKKSKAPKKKKPNRILLFVDKKDDNRVKSSPSPKFG